MAKWAEVPFFPHFAAISNITRERERGGREDALDINVISLRALCALISRCALCTFPALPNPERSAHKLLKDRGDERIKSSYRSRRRRRSRCRCRSWIGSRQRRVISVSVQLQLATFARRCIQHSFFSHWLMKFHPVVLVPACLGLSRLVPACPGLSGLSGQVLPYANPQRWRLARSCRRLLT